MSTALLMRADTVDPSARATDCKKIIVDLGSVIVVRTDFGDPGIG